jgi:hypothetical protein
MGCGPPNKEVRETLKQHVDSLVPTSKYKASQYCPKCTHARVSDTFLKHGMPL